MAIALAGCEDTATPEERRAIEEARQELHQWEREELGCLDSSAAVMFYRLFNKDSECNKNIQRQLTEGDSTKPGSFDADQQQHSVKPGYKDGLTREIASVERMIPPQQEYLFKADTFTGAVSSVWTNLSHVVIGQRKPQDVYDEFFLAAGDYRSLAQRELRYAERLKEQGKPLAALQHVQNARHLIKLCQISGEGAVQVFNDGIANATTLAEGIYSGSKAAVIYGSTMAALPAVGAGSLKVASAIDYAYMALDYAIDVSDSGTAFANKKLAKELLIKILLSEIPIDRLDGNTIAEEIAESTTEIVGQSGLYEIISEPIESQYVREQVMILFAEGAAHFMNEATQTEIMELVDVFLHELRFGLQSAESLE